MIFPLQVVVMRMGSNMSLVLSEHSLGRNCYYCILIYPTFTQLCSVPGLGWALWEPHRKGVLVSVLKDFMVEVRSVTKQEKLFTIIFMPLEVSKQYTLGASWRSDSLDVSSEMMVLVANQLSSLLDPGSCILASWNAHGFPGQCKCILNLEVWLEVREIFVIWPPSDAQGWAVFSQSSGMSTLEATVADISNYQRRYAKYWKILKCFVLFYFSLSHPHTFVCKWHRFG